MLHAPRALIVLALATCLVAGSAAVAAAQDAAATATRRLPVTDERARRVQQLDGRFLALKAAMSEEAAQPIVAEIWELWHQSGETLIDGMLRDAAAAMAVGDGALADALLTAIIERRPDFPEGWNKRATLRFIAGRYDESLADCIEVLNREPRHFGALAGMGLIALQQGNHKGALAAFRRAQTIHPFLGERRLIKELEKKVEGEAL